MDNNQKGYPLKFLRGVSSKKFMKVTGTCLHECIETTKEIHSIVNRAELLYINQPVPSPVDMPPFESLLDTQNSIGLIVGANI